jgi:hypothetical protein
MCVRRFLQLIGWTPLIELKRIAGKDGVDARIVGKVEAYQPLCSVKDRSALRSDFFPPLVTQLVREFRIQMPDYLFQLAYCFWIN